MPSQMQALSDSTMTEKMCETQESSLCWAPIIATGSAFYSPGPVHPNNACLLQARHQCLAASGKDTTDNKKTQFQSAQLHIPSNGHGCTTEKYPGGKLATQVCWSGNEVFSVYLPSHRTSHYPIFKAPGLATSWAFAVISYSLHADLLQEQALSS